MKRVNLKEITSKTPLKLDFEIQPSLVELPEEVAKIVSPLTVQVEIFKSAMGYTIRGFIEGEFEFVCSRCAKTFRENIRKEFSYELLPTSLVGSGEVKFSELEVDFSDSEFLDIVEVVRGQLLLDLPVKQLCSEDCEVPEVKINE